MLGKTILSLLALAGSSLALPAESKPDLAKRALPVGQVLTQCTVPGTVAITLDDGPWQYTNQAIDMLNAAGMKGTFFVNGQNWDNINNWASTVQRMRNSGHQVGSHTYSHANLAYLDASGVTSEMTRLETDLLNILGVWATYMRPPYLSTTQSTLSTLGGLGYYVIGVDLDTVDWNYQNNIGQALTNFRNGLNAGGRNVLIHDVHRNTVQQLLPQMITEIRNRGLRAVTVGECMGDPSSNWYRPARTTAPSNPPTTTPPPTTPPSNLPVSTDATCGAAAGYRCPANTCCSRYNWCGTSSEHCTNGCQPLYGTCL
jgi:peptidoglycan/xylan/chitin deacetylase (PgdA/CDA1 family)